MDVFEPAADFNERIIGITRPQTPTPLSPSRRKAIADHLREEAQELEDAETLADQADALTDVMFIAAGRFYETGMDGNAHYRETSRANRSRVRGNNPKRPNSFGFDAVKPEGWQEPNHELIVRRTSAGHLQKRVLILGSARHGKDTVAEVLRDKYGYHFSSSSMFLAEQVMMPYFARVGAPYPNVQACYDDRINHRATWFDQIADYNSVDPTRLTREMQAIGNDIYVGMRSAAELAASRELFDVIIWVDAFRRGLPYEDISSFNISFSPEFILVDNGGTVEETEAQVDALIREGVL